MVRSLEAIVSARGVRDWVQKPKAFNSIILLPVEGPILTIDIEKNARKYCGEKRGKTQVGNGLRCWSKWGG